MARLLWKPDLERQASTEMTRFMKTELDSSFVDYEELHAWSIDHLEDFWERFVDFSGIRYSRRHKRILSSESMPGAQWFEGMRLNYAENALQESFTGPAILAMAEDSEEVTTLEFPQLRSLVACCAGALSRAGVGQNDRVAGYAANIPETVIAALASASLGATWSSASPDFGLDALVDRLAQVQPKILFASTHYRYGGRLFETDGVLQEIRSRVSSIERIVALPDPGCKTTGEATLVRWDEFLDGGKDARPVFEQLPFAHPLYILFSSGTTGRPKCMVHGAGGALLQHKKEHQLHCDLRPGDRLLYFTTCGWMMWNWQLSALASGATICLFDGNPGHPDLDKIWRVVERMGVTHFGTSGRFLESCMKRSPSFQMGDLGELPALRTVLYTGSPLSPGGFEWIYKTVKQDVHFAGISGGTDIVSCFVLGNPNLPVRAGEIQCRGLGVDVVSMDERGRVVEGEAGELVCRKPLPSMPLYFLDDPDGEKYHEAYFDTYPGLWRHGDYVEFTSGGGIIVHGRSDATLNPGGVRIGSAEIYSALDSLSEVTGAVVVGWQPPGQSDEIIVLFVVGRDQRYWGEKIREEIRQTIRKRCSPRHVPRVVLPISAIPVTRSGKPVELSVKAILRGQQVSNRDALANPEILSEFEEARELLLRRWASR